MNDLENHQVVNLMQAALGSITANIRAISLKCKDKNVSLFFLLEHERHEDREEIGDIIFEFEALQLSNINVDVDIQVDSRSFSELHIPGRVVYLRHES